MFQMNERVPIKYLWDVLKVIKGKGAIDGAKDSEGMEINRLS